MVGGVDGVTGEVTGMPMLVKGLSIEGRDEKFTRTLTGYNKYLETDYSRFDRTISREYLVQVQDPILSYPFPKRDHPLFHQALKLARDTSGVSDYGVSYKTEGSRCSGDAHTSIGNGFINAFNTWLLLRSYPAVCWASLHEGDDGVIGLDSRVQNPELLILFLGCLGFEVKAFVYNSLDDVSFCGRHYYTDNGVVHSHADILRSAAKFHTTLSNLKAENAIYAKSLSYHHTDRNTPLIGMISWALASHYDNKLSFSAKKRGIHVLGKERYMVDAVKCGRDITPPTVDTAARVSCMRRTGITIEQQLYLEDVYSQARVRGPLMWPKIDQNWILRKDGFVFGQPEEFVW